MVDHDPADGKEKPTMRCSQTGGAGIDASRCDSVRFQDGYSMKGNSLRTSDETQRRRATQYMSILNKDGTESICSAGKDACDDMPEKIHFFQVTDTNFFHLSEHYHYLTVRDLRIGYGRASSSFFSGHSWWLSGPECTKIRDGTGLRCPTDQNAYVIFQANGEGFTVTSEPDCDAVLGVRAYWKHVTDAGPTGGSYTYKHGTEELKSVSNKATYTDAVVSKIEADIGRFVGLPKKVLSGGTSRTITNEVVQSVQTDLRRFEMEEIDKNLRPGDSMWQYVVDTATICGSYTTRTIHTSVVATPNQGPCCVPKFFVDDTNPLGMCRDGLDLCREAVDIPTCSRPPTWCTHQGAIFSMEDCDGDGVDDPTCKTTFSNQAGSLSSANDCEDTWQNTPCWKFP